MKGITLLHKRFIAVGVIIFVAMQLGAQTDTLKNLPNLLLPQFMKSIVKLKSGNTYTAILNYDLVEQEMVFLQRKLTLVLDEPQLVDTIYMANRTFVPFQKGFYELMVTAPITLFIQHKSYLESVGTPTGYGAMSQTTPPSYVRQIYGATGAINLTIPSGFKVVDDSENWIRRNNTMNNFKTKRQFLKIFPDKEKELNQFINKNYIDFKKPQDLVKLVNYCNELSW